MVRKIICAICTIALLFSSLPAALPTLAIDAVEEVEALYFEVKPNIDGIVTEAEWGPMTTYVDQRDAATIEDTQPVNNRFFYRNPAAVPGFDTTLYSMYYELWLRWDEDYYYVAVRAKDPDGHSLKNAKKQTKNGDGFQFMLDPFGSNAGDDPTIAKPWSNVKTVPDICAGFAQIADGFTEVWDNVANVGITPLLGGSVKAEVVPSGASYSKDSANGWTTYELAIPWNYLDTLGHDYSNYTRRNQDGGIGKEYGMSAVLYNADGTAGSRTYNAALSWGSGILDEQQMNHPSTCAGSNPVILSGEKVRGTPTHGAGYNPPAPIPSYPIKIDGARHIGPLTYDSESDLDIFGGNNIYIGGHIKQDSDGNNVVYWDEDTEDLPGSPTYSALNESSFLSTRGNENGELTFDGLGSYTMEFDIKVTDTKIFEDGYPCQLYNWFGGWSGFEYECGYNFDTAKFYIADYSSGKVLASKSGSFTLNEWHHWVFQYFKDSCEIRFYFDPPMRNGRVARSAVPVFCLNYRYFDMPGVTSNEVTLKRMNCQIMMDNVEFYNFVDFTQFNPDPVVYVFGDADHDGELTMKDVLLMRRIVAGLVEDYCAFFPCADTDWDGELTIKDVLKMRRVIAGLDEAPAIWPPAVN